MQIEYLKGKQPKPVQDKTNSDSIVKKALEAGVEKKKVKRRG